MDDLLTPASRPTPRHVYIGTVFISIRPGAPEARMSVYTIEERDRLCQQYLDKNCVVRVDEMWNPPAR